MMNLLIISLFCIIAITNAQVPFFGKCPTVSVKQSFNVGKYSGTWYENRKYFFIFELGGKCVTAEYTNNNDGTVKVVNTQINIFTNQTKNIVGSAKLADPTKGEGRLIVNFATAPFNSNTANYLVLDTDYNSYSAVFSCTSYGLFSIQSAWILTRERIPSQNVIDLGLTAFKNNGVNANKLIITNQPMAKFDMNRFLGQWHEAERYFPLSEVGSRCVTTNYEKMPDGRVWVSNEIRNSFTGVKRVVEGQLQVVGRDGEGKLSVKYTSLPVPYEGQYLILDTDYKSFAVMWSCSGAGPIHAQNAWILTRERLAPGAVLQRAYGILDKLKISRAFFVQTNQEDCTVQPAPLDSVDPTPDPLPVQGDNDVKSKNVDGPVVPAVVAVVSQHKIEEKVEEVKPVVAVKTVPELIHANAESSDKKEEVLTPVVEVQKDIVEPEKVAEAVVAVEKVKEEIKPLEVIADEVQQIVPEKVEPVIKSVDPVPEKVEVENKVVEQCPGQGLMVEKVSAK